MPTNPQPLLYPNINGKRWDFSSLKFAANGSPLPGITSADYGNELAGADVYANGSAQKIGATRGQLKSNLSFDILAEEYENLIFALCVLNETPGSGYMEVRWDLEIQKQDGQGANQGPLFTDICRGAKLKKVAKGYKVGPEGLMTKCECDVFYVIENGQVPVGINPADPRFTLG